MTNLTPELVSLGDALERSIGAAATPADDLGRRRARRRRLLLIAAAFVLAVPGLALAAYTVFGEDEVAASLPAGTKMLAGTEPRCAAVIEGVEYHCTLTKPIAHPEVSDLTNTAEPTVDASKHVNGGCRSLDTDGRNWQCYIGQAAVDQKIISRNFLGEYAPTPGVG